MEVININSKKKIVEDEQKKAMLQVLDYMRKEIEKGEIKEFVAASLDSDGIAQIHVCAMDLPGSIGLFEIGKHLLISQESEIG